MLEATIVTASGVLGADLAPWWFAAAFWVALLALAVVVVRDLRRLGGPRRVIAAIQRALDHQARSDRSHGGSDHEQPRAD